MATGAKKKTQISTIFFLLDIVGLTVSVSVHWVAHLYYCIAWLFNETSTYLLSDIKRHTHTELLLYLAEKWVRMGQLFKLFWFIVAIYVCCASLWLKDARAHTYTLPYRHALESYVFRKTCLNYVFNHFDFRPWARLILSYLTHALVHAQTRKRKKKLFVCMAHAHVPSFGRLFLLLPSVEQKKGEKKRNTKLIVTAIAYLYIS